MSWFSCDNEIKDKIRDLESDINYLERDASSAKDKCSNYMSEYSSLISSLGYNETYESKDLLRESNYWGNVNSSIEDKIRDIESEIRDLERQL